MKQRDILALIDGVTPGIDASFQKAVAPLLERLAAAEKRVAELEKAPADIDLDAIIAAAVEKALAAQPKAPTAAEVAALVPVPTVPTAEEVSALVAPGKDADPEVIASMVRDAAAALMKPMQTAIDAAIRDVQACTEAATAEMKEACERSIADLPKVPTAEEVRALIPTPEAGKDADPEVIKAMVAEAVAAIPRIVQDGKDATPDQIAEAVERALATWERPKDGTSVTLEQLRPLVDETVAKRVAEIPVPKDGVGLAGMLIDRDGELVATLTDGTTKKLGPVVGKDGDPGLSVDDLELLDDGENVIFRMSRGEKVKEWRLPKATLADFYKGVWKPGSYTRGQVVTWGGSLWMAKADTQTKPETTEDWVLITKRGRDGKDGRDLNPTPPKPVKL